MKAGHHKKILLLDNYDSFTFNLFRALEAAGMQDITVVKNDAMRPEEADDFEAMVISPGPGYPATSGVCCELIRRFAGHKPILGICLGHQAIAEVFGAQLYHLPQVRHGVQVHLKIIENDITFTSLEGEIAVGLYHSWAVSRENLPACLQVTSVSEEEVVMSLRHRQFNIHGWQFHPESIMTPQGIRMLGNWAASALS